MSTTIQPTQRVGRPRKHPQKDERVATLDFTPTVGGMAAMMSAPGVVREMMCVGTRGDGKTIGVLAGMLGHAAAHHGKGFDLPVKWLGVTDTSQ